MRPRVLVVRSGVTPFSTGREGLSVEIVEKPSHDVEPLVSGEEALDAPADLAIFTSQIAVRRLFEERSVLTRFQGALAGGQIASVGPATAEALKSHGLQPHLVAGGSSASILDQIPRRLHGSRVILPRGEDAARELPDELERRGAKAFPLVLYRKMPRPCDPTIEEGLRGAAFAAFFPTSPSAALWLFKGLSCEAMDHLRRIPAAVLGRFTRRYLGAHGIERVEVAHEPTFAAAAEVLERLAAPPPAS